MNAPRLLAAVGALLFCALPASVRAQGVTSHRNSDGSCNVAGTVASATTHGPVAGAWVALSIQGAQSQSFPPPIDFYQVFTDARGHFEIRNIPPMNYYLAIGKDGFVVWRNQGTGCHESPEMAVHHRPIQLMPAGVISGRVTDANGNPLFGARVRAVSLGYGETRQRIETTSQWHFSTDDRGDYRIFGLAPGRYLVVVDYEPGIAYPWLRSQAPLGGAVSSQLTYPWDVFYPGTRQISKAKAILIAPGRHVSRIDFRLVAYRMHDVSGTISGLQISQHPPNIMPNVSMHVCGNGDVSRPWPSMMNAAVTLDGKFLVRNVPPGCYELRVQQDQRGKGPRTAELRLEVSDHDIRGLHPTVHQPWNIPLQIVATGSPAPLRASVFLIGEDGRTFGAVRREGKSWILEGVPPGSYAISIIASSLPMDAYLKSARLGPCNVLTQRIRISPSRSPGLLRVVIGRDGAELSGTVTRSDGKEDAGASVVLVPAPPFRDVRCLYKRALTNPSGVFLLRGIRPGDYTLYAWDGIQYPNRLWFDPLFLKEMEGRGTAIRFAQGQHRTAHLHSISIFSSGGDKH